MQKIFQKLTGDQVLWMVSILLALISLLAVYSSISTLAYKADGNSFKFLFKHSAMLMAGLAIMYYVHKVPYRYFSKISQLLIWVAGVLLFFTLAFGLNINDASRWLRVPFLGITFQTSDFAKIALIVYLAKLLNQKRTALHSFKDGVIPVLTPIIIICGLILPADLSTALILFMVGFIMMFIAGVPIKHLLKIVVIAIAALALIYLIGKAAPGLFGRLDTWISRIENFMNPDSTGNYQIDFAQIAINQGGLFPQGPGSGFTRNFMPHPYSDMIYAFIIEEYGAILGGMGLLLLYIIFLYRSIRTANKCQKPFGSLVALGLSMMLVLQAFIHMAVAVDLFPTTGQPLPLVSMGGTSILFTSLSIGIVLSVSRSVYNPETNTDKDYAQSGQNHIKKPAHANT